MTLINNNPILVGANPKILSLDGIPALDFIDGQSFGKNIIQFKKKHNKFGAPEERIIRYKGVDYETEMNYLNIKNLKKTYTEFQSKKTGSYDLDKKHIKKGENPGFSN